MSNTRKTSITERRKYPKHFDMWAKRVATEGTPHQGVGKPNHESFDNIMAVIVKTFRLIGIPLDPSGMTSTIFRYWSIGLGSAMFLSNVGTNSYVFLSLTTSFDSTKVMTTSNWSFFIHISSFVISLVGVHAGLLISTSLKWKAFMGVLLQIDKLHIFKKEDFKRFQKIFRKGIIVSTLLVIRLNIFYD